MDRISAMRELDYGITTAVQALVEAMGMMSENMQRQHYGQPMCFTIEAFQELVDKYGINHNAVLARWQKIS